MPSGGPRPGFGGKQPGAGRPKKEITDIRRRWQKKWLTEWVSDEEMRSLCQATMKLAMRGDTAARADVFKYLLGNPPVAVEVSGDQRLVIEYSNDWRGENRPALSASGPAGSPSPGATDEFH